MSLRITPGNSFPLGATVETKGVNFCVYSQHATGIDLILYDSPEAPYPEHTIHLDPDYHRSFNYWHAFVHGLKAGQVYAYRATGPHMPEHGHRFDPSKVLLDPYGQSVVGQSIYDRQAACHPGENSPYALRNVVVDLRAYDWEGDTPLDIPYSRTVIYEMHVKGLTNHPSSGVAPKQQGTFAGVIEKIPYLKSLGITALELLPVHQFDDRDAPLGLSNYWGYSTIGFFAPHRAYSSRQDPSGPVDEFRDMVKALHKADIEVILDVVFNHTAEGDHRGPTLSLRGLDNRTYYILEEEDPALYANYSGCGNTVKAGHTVVSRLILDSLRYWVSEMHVDGFRFDLASVMSRDKNGNPLDDPPILWAIESDPVLARTKLIAEAWDAAGLYQVGSFIGDRFAEWNGPFRDDVRRFVKGDNNTVGPLAARLLGSPDLFVDDPDRETNRSINFVTCHDGFTLSDVVSYNRKHNEANGEQNRDGSNDNFSWNCGIEGLANTSEIQKLRMQQIKNFITILLVSQGTPMVLMGDEACRTQKGNNNAYCQDTLLNWFNWENLDSHHEIVRFTQHMVDLVQNLRLFQQTRWLTVTERFVDAPHIIWHGTKLFEPDWSEHSHSLAFTLHDPAVEEEIHVILNAYWESLLFDLPQPHAHSQWYRVVNTARPAPDDIIDNATEPVKSGHQYPVEARSCVVLMAL
ncbi:glycogen debranching protein GlgX [Oscillatoria sp. CS-180]|uniref:glycogen debranching protein GlgX n=1 Tax=Oscillatoria sp. CS-180 TaxID=3021720 RepID=UPI00232EE9F5|nr:glycogen debranching protein GlgX [Oscillatoria sp. CS-180]MDB9528499.1 glycogen debranching protein GlgX [Oscillatoria sp. CS-180]